MYNIYRKLVGINDQETKNFNTTENVRRNYFFFTLNKTTRCMQYKSMVKNIYKARRFLERTHRNDCYINFNRVKN